VNTSSDRYGAIHSRPAWPESKPRWSVIKEGISESNRKPVQPCDIRYMSERRADELVDHHE
jgi:hypothetical protein